jgi:hypothetical protein
MTFSLVSHVTITTTEHGMVALNQRTGRYFQLNGTGAEVLTWLLDGHSVASAAANLGNQHPDAADRAENDVNNLIQALREAKVIEL